MILQHVYSLARNKQTLNTRYFDPDPWQTFHFALSVMNIQKKKHNFTFTEIKASYYFEGKLSDKRIF